MRRLIPALTVVFVLPAAVVADEAGDLRDRALKAAAKDPADLNKFRTYTIKAKGVSKLSPEPVQATFELAAVYPGQLKASWEFGRPPATTRLTMCAFNDRGWQRLGTGPANPLGIEDLNDLRADAYALSVATLLPLTDRDTRIATAGKSKVNGEAVVGLKVTRSPWPEVTLWFDEKTYLLRKMAYRSREQGALLNKEMIYSGHKEQAGVMVPTTHSTVVQGKEIYNWTEMEYAFPDKIDPATFAKP
jgi:hypothetical protein